MMQHFVSSNALANGDSAASDSELLVVAHLPVPDFIAFVGSVWLSTATPTRSR